MDLEEEQRKLWWQQYLLFLWKLLVKHFKEKRHSFREKHTCLRAVNVIYETVICTAVGKGSGLKVVRLTLSFPPLELTHSTFKMKLNVPRLYSYRKY